jgi:hypothetical protein
LVDALCEARIGLRGLCGMLVLEALGGRLFRIRGLVMTFHTYGLPAAAAPDSHAGSGRVRRPVSIAQSIVRANVSRTGV